MQKVISLAILCLSFLIGFMANATDPVDFLPEPPEENEVDWKNIGRRTPPAPVMCLIDFEEGTISGDAPILATVTDYQLWDADGSACITASPIPADVLTYAADSPGETFILRLITPTVTLRAGCHLSPSPRVPGGIWTEDPRKTGG